MRGSHIKGLRPTWLESLIASCHRVRRSLLRGSLFLLRLDLGQCFPVLQFSFEHFHERVSKSIEDGGKHIRARVLECARKRNARAEPVFRVVADDMGEATEDGLPDKGHWIFGIVCGIKDAHVIEHRFEVALVGAFPRAGLDGQDRKSTRLNSSHLVISYAVFCLKKNITADSIFRRQPINTPFYMPERIDAPERSIQPSVWKHEIQRSG